MKLKHILTFLLISHFLCHSYGVVPNTLYFASDPSLSPDGNTIYFSYEGDIWQVPANGGQALRLTAMDGIESRPLVSPDGQYLAFSATRNGNRDIFILPLQGGNIEQLTWHSAWDDVDAWSWDSRQIYFTSNRYNRYGGYRVSVQGGTPVRLFEHYFNTIHNLAEHPDGAIYFNESWESKSFAHRKGYRGDYNPDIKSYHPATGQYTKHTDFRGKDFGATIDRQGQVYFISDEYQDEYNLYTFREGVKVRLTEFDRSIYWPRVSASGNKVVFSKEYQIYVYDVATGTTSRPDIQLGQHSYLNKEEAHELKGNISHFSVSPDNKKIAMVSRGVLFVSDIKGQLIRRITTDAGEAVGEVHWLKDNKTLLFTQTYDGYYNWFSVAVDENTPLRQYTSDRQNKRNLAFNSNRSKAVYLSGRNEVRLLDLQTFASTTIVQDELWALYNPTPSFSPDDRYIIYTARRDFEFDLFVYDLALQRSIQLMRTRVSENEPAWSPDGKYLYLACDRYQPSYPYGTQQSHIYRLPLQSYDEAFRSEAWKDLFSEVSDTSESEQTDTSGQVLLDTINLWSRMEAIGPSFGEQSSPQIIKVGDKSIILYLSDHDEGGTHLWKTTLEDFTKPKTEKISEKPVRGYQLATAADKHYLLSGGHLFTLDAAGGKLEAIDIQADKFHKRIQEEFQQMFYEAWAGFEENFYDEDFHGRDWKALRDRYAQYLPYTPDRAAFDRLLNDLLGELNTSHFGFYTDGPEDDPYFGDVTAACGLLFADNDPYRVVHIIREGPADHHEQDIQPGDLLVGVAGKDIDPTHNREQYFTGPSFPEELILTFERQGSRFEVPIHPVRPSEQANLLYDEWQYANQSYVDQKSNRRIGYIHMKNMGRSQFRSFMEDLLSEDGYRDGLILDLRYNTGGNVHDDVLRVLSQRKYLEWKYREGALTGQSNLAPADKPLVLLINEQSLSDAEMTATGFKALGLGTIIGTETYRWIIFTSGKSLVDGSFYRLPSWGCYTLDGANLEKEGVQPDIRVDKHFKQRLQDEHPQLDKAIEVILQELGGW